MDKQDVEYRMYSLKSICDIFDELLSYNTGDDFWKRCVCEASIHDLETEMCDGEVEQCPEEISLREMLNITLRNFMDDMKIEDMNREDLHDLCGSFRFLLSKRCPIAYSANYSEYLKDVKEQGIKDYADEIVALYTLVEQYKKY